MNEFRASFIAAFEASNEAYKSETIGSYELAKTILDDIANYTLYLHECSLMHDFSNYGWVEQKVDGEWIEIDDVEDDS
jgi:hypothetical protein